MPRMIGDRPLTNAEKQARVRARKRAMAEALVEAREALLEMVDNWSPGAVHRSRSAINKADAALGR